MHLLKLIYQAYLVIEFHSPTLGSSSDKRSILIISDFLDTLNLTICERRDDMSTLMSEELVGVSVPS